MMPSYFIVKLAYAVVVVMTVSRGLKWRTIVVDTEDFGELRFTTRTNDQLNERLAQRLRRFRNRQRQDAVIDEADWH